jgi:TetR/AcrR family transcriptional regulator, cholesterol catabolism regulator
VDTGTVNSGEQVDRQSRILEAALDLLSRHGISGVNMRAVAREAGVALGLVNYYYEDKSSLIRAALHRIDEHDLMLVAPDPASPPDEQLRAALRRVAGPELLTTRYLSLRLHLWALAQAHEDFAVINAAAFDRYLDGLATLIANAKPELSREECRERAADIVVVQNGMWLTALLGVDKASIQRNLARTEQIAFAGSRESRQGPGARPQ